MRTVNYPTLLLGEPLLLGKRQVAQRLAPLSVDRLRLRSPTAQSQQRLRPQAEMDQPLDALLAPYLIRRQTELLLGVPESSFDGLITNDKFCFTHRHQLPLSWSRRPLRLREQVIESGLQNE